MLIALVWAIEMSLSPYLLKMLIDAVGKYQNNSAMMIQASIIPACIYVGMTLVTNLNFRLYDYITLRLYPDIKAAVDIDMFAYLLNHSHAFFQNNFTGSLTKKIADMMSNIDTLISIPNEWFYPRLFALIIASGTLFKVVHPVFGLILFTWSIAFIALTYFAATKAEKLSRELAESSTKRLGTISDSITNIMSIKLFANASYAINHLRNDIASLVHQDRRFQWYNLKIHFIQGIGVTILISAMLSALLYGQTHGWVSAGDFAMVLMLSITFMWSVHDVCKQMQQYSKVVGICNQALTFMNIPHDIAESPDATPIYVTKGDIRFENVSFQYENNTPLFKKLNLTIRAGEKVGLVGYSGGGKSTLIKLILRLIDVQSGRILIDDQDIKHSTQDALRAQIGSIPQEPDLFHRSIMDNIRFARIDASDDDVIAAAISAQCDEFINSLPDKYQSLVGERGIKLSGGQKQRIAIARAFLKNAPILLLDEATSALDSITEQYIHEALHQVIENKTTLVIAHRLSTLKDMDRILVFVEGDIVEDGSLDELLKNQNGHFYKLWHMQAAGFIPEKILAKPSRD